MGRHKKIFETVTSVDSTNESTEVTTETKTRGRKPIEHFNLCDICGKKFKTTPRYLNLSYLTSVAGYHRECSDRIMLCNDCAIEISDVIDKWIIKKNPELKKFKI